MNIAAINHDSALDAIRHGRNTRAKLGERFEVLPTSPRLAEVLRDLTTSGEVVEHEGGVLHVNDLTEQLPHKPEERQ